MLGEDIQRAYEKKEIAIKNRRSFIFTETSYTITIRFTDQKRPVKYVYTESVGEFSTFSLMSKLKKEIDEKTKGYESNMTYWDSRKIKYFEFAPSVYKCEKNIGEIQEFKNVVEMDITAAYTYAFYRQGFISKKLFDEIMGLNKKERQKVNGSIATKKLVEKYYKGECIMKKPVLSKSRRNIWFFISKIIDDLMIKCYRAGRNKSIFYFVDGIYFYKDDELINKFHEIFEKAGFLCKMININKFAVINVDRHLSIEIEKEDGEKKTFEVPKKQVIKYYIHDEKYE